MTSQDRVELRKPFVSPRAKRAIAPYLYQSPTIVLMAALMLYPIFTVVRYSLMDNVIINKHPLFVGSGISPQYLGTPRSGFPSATLSISPVASSSSSTCSSGWALP